VVAILADRLVLILEGRELRFRLRKPLPPFAGEVLALLPDGPGVIAWSGPRMESAASSFWTSPAGRPGRCEGLRGAAQRAREFGQIFRKSHARHLPAREVGTASRSPRQKPSAQATSSSASRRSKG
jgi:hypothetical protein